jgi:hypothetical protein
MLAIERRGQTDYQLGMRAKKFKFLVLVFGLQLIITAASWSAGAAIFPKEKPMSLHLQWILIAIYFSVPFLAYMRVLYDILPSRIEPTVRIIILCPISLLLAWIGMCAGEMIWFAFF